MEYTCGVCQKKINGDLLLFKDHTEDHIIDLVKKEHPHWVKNDGVCAKCLEYYRNQLKGDHH